jgi:hypothetical protein
MRWRTVCFSFAMVVACASDEATTPEGAATDSETSGLADGDGEQPGGSEPTASGNDSSDATSSSGDPTATESQSTTAGTSTSAEPDDTEDAPTGASETTGSDPDPVDAVPPDQLDALIEWLESGGYVEWDAESSIHASAGPHFGNVRTFFNLALSGSFAAGSTDHPMGAAAVKELYGPGNALRGWAAMVKRPQDAGAWYWFEIYDGTLYADAVSLSLCENCHGAGTDQVLTPFPLP